MGLQPRCDGLAQGCRFAREQVKACLSSSTGSQGRLTCQRQQAATLQSSGNSHAWSGRQQQVPTCHLTNSLALPSAPVLVGPVNDPPVLQSSNYTILEDNTLVVAAPGVLTGASDAENNTLTVVGYSSPAHGNLTLNADGSFTYAPNANFNGQDSFTYNATDGNGGYAAATVTITIREGQWEMG